MSSYSHINSSSSLYTFSQSFGVDSLKVKKLAINLGSNIANKNLKLKKLNTYTIKNFFNINHYTKFLKLQIKKNLKFIIELKITRGVRHRLGLPTRGQRTKTNAKTKKRFKIHS
jgi:small subunit ribosomal protein S13